MTDSFAHKLRCTYGSYSRYLLELFSVLSVFRLAGFIYDVIALVQSALGLVHPPVEK